MRNVKDTIIFALLLLSLFLHFAPEEQVLTKNEEFRLEGVVVPSEGMIAVIPPQKRIIEQVLVKEGDSVEKGQILCILERSLELGGVKLAEAKRSAKQAKAEISKQRYLYDENLFDKGAIASYRLETSSLQASFAANEALVAEKEVELAQIKSEQLILRSPCDGIVQRCQIQEGELFSTDDRSSLIIGKGPLAVSLFISQHVAAELQKKDLSLFNRKKEGMKVSGGKVLAMHRQGPTEFLGKKVSLDQQQWILELDPASDLPFSSKVYVE